MPLPEDIQQFVTACLLDGERSDTLAVEELMITSRLRDIATALIHETDPLILERLLLEGNECIVIRARIRNIVGQITVPFRAAHRHPDQVPPYEELHARLDAIDQVLQSFMLPRVSAETEIILYAPPTLTPAAPATRTRPVRVDSIHAQRVRLTAHFVKSLSAADTSISLLEACIDRDEVTVAQVRDIPAFDRLGGDTPDIKFANMHERFCGILRKNQTGITATLDRAVGMMSFAINDPEKAKAFAASIADPTKVDWLPVESANTQFEVDTGEM